MTNNRFEMGLLLHVVEMIRKQWSLNGLLNIGVLIPGLLDDAAELVLGDTLMGDLGGGVSDLGQVGGYTAHNRVEAYSAHATPASAITPKLRALIFNNYKEHAW